MAEEIEAGKVPRKKKEFKIGKVSIHIETTATLLNPGEAWKPYKESDTDARTGTSITKILDMAVARFKDIKPRLSETDKRWARFVQKAGGEMLVIFKAEKDVRGNCVISAAPYTVYLYFSTGDHVSITIRHEWGYAATDEIPLSGDPSIAIRLLKDKINVVMKSGVEFPSEDY